MLPCMLHLALTKTKSNFDWLVIQGVGRKSIEVSVRASGRHVCVEALLFVSLLLTPNPNSKGCTVGEPLITPHPPQGPRLM